MYSGILCAIGFPVTHHTNEQKLKVMLIANRPKKKILNALLMVVCSFYFKVSSNSFFFQIASLSSRRFPLPHFLKDRIASMMRSVVTEIRRTDTPRRSGAVGALVPRSDRARICRLANVALLNSFLSKGHLRRLRCPSSP